MNSTTKWAFLLKIAVGVIIAEQAGWAITNVASYPYWETSRQGHFMPEFIYTFFSLACIVIMQWLLLSEHLPKWWVIFGFMGAVIAATVTGMIFWSLSNETYNSHYFEIITLNAALSGMFLTIPQWFLLRNKKGYLWVLANIFGLVIDTVGWYKLMDIHRINAFLLALERIILISPIPFALMIGIYLHTYFYSPHIQFVEDRKGN